MFSSTIQLRNIYTKLSVIVTKQLSWNSNVQMSVLNKKNHSARTLGKTTIFPQDE